MTEADVQSRTGALFDAHRTAIFRRTDRLFAWLLIIQWIAGIVVSLLISPKTWSGQISQVHVHVWAAVFLGGIIVAFPVYLAFFHSGTTWTRQAIAAAQMLYSALLIHLTGGRLETHFHVFGSLAFLAIYRDWKVLLTAGVVVYLDHFVRGLYWPQSVYGVLTAGPLRALEHAWWVVFEVAFLVVAIRQSANEMWAMAERQARLEQTNAAIEATVKERTSQLKDLNSQMEDFCYSMAHDLRAPLRSLQGFSRLLLEEHSSRLESEGQEFAKRIDTSAARMDSLLSDLLNYSRIAKCDLELGRIDLEQIFREVLDLLGNEIKIKGAVVEIKEPLIPVTGHAATLVQVVINLVSNALKFVGHGVRPHLRIWTEQSGADVKLLVNDNGIGIEPHQRGKVFKMFERLHRDYEGTGMGLAFVQKSVERMGGTVGMKSNPGQGSTFWVQLRAADPLQGRKAK